jgi:hypothetical protein
MSYHGQVDFGLVGDYDAMTDLESFALDLEGAVREVLATAPRPPRQAAPAGAPARAGNGAVSVK